MDVRLPDGTVIRGVPDDMSKADLTAKLARNGYDVSKLNPSYNQVPATTSKFPVSANDVKRARELAQPEPNWRDDNVAGRIVGPIDAGLSMLSGMVAAPVSVPAGFVQSAFNGKAPEKNASAIAEAMTRRPSTGTGGQMLGMVGQAAPVLAALPFHGSIEAAQGVGSGVGALRGMAGPSAAAMAAQDAQMAAGAGKLSDLVRAPKPAMAGVGAAETTDAAQRAARFAAMRAPMQPTKGILTRSIDDVQFEREAAKRPEGKGLDNRFAELNKGMAQHLDELVEETGAKSPSLRDTGKTVRNAVEMKQKAKKAEVDKAYADARAAPESAELVDIQPILDFVGKNRSAARNAGIIHSIEDETNRLSQGTGKISVSDMEELRKMVGDLSEPGTANGKFGGDAIKLIDKVTDGKGGPLYQQARRLNENMMKEFADRDVIDKLLRTKRGTKDRAVANADVADHILFDGSLEDMKHAFRVLEAHPVGTAPEIVAAGQQAAKELRGAAAAKLKERMFSNDGADSAGKTVGSSAQINRIVKELDRDGKLDYLFGKQGAAEIRDTAQVATDLYTTPKGTMNSSNTASAMEKVLDRMAGATGGTPVVGHAIKYLAKKAESRAYSKKVDAALNPPANLSDMAGERK